MYKLKTSQSFDSAHFLSGYVGKCSNIHGHRWTVEVTIQSETLQGEGEKRGMCVDFSQLKEALKEMTEEFDHAFIFEKGTLRQKTIEALKEEKFRMIEVDFRPTAENFAKYFYDIIAEKGYDVAEVVVYETPNKCASYSE